MFISIGFINNSEVDKNSERELIGTTSLINIGEFQKGNSTINPLLNDDLLIQKCDAAKNEYLVMIHDVHSLLENYNDLTNTQRLEYCNSERHFMKQYLKHALIKVNKCFPD